MIIDAITAAEAVRSREECEQSVPTLSMHKHSYTQWLLMIFNPSIWEERTVEHKCIIPLHQGSFKIPTVKLFPWNIVKRSRGEKGEKHSKKVVYATLQLTM